MDEDSGMSFAARMSSIGHAGSMSEGGGGGGGGGNTLSIGGTFGEGLAEQVSNSTMASIAMLGFNTLCNAAPYILGGDLASVSSAFLAMFPPIQTPPLVLPTPGSALFGKGK